MILRRIVLFAMLIAVSGLPGYFMQGAAWWDMARKSGGLYRLSQAMFEQEPCGRCHAARGDFHRTGDPEDPAPAERLQTFRLQATLSKTVTIPRVWVETHRSRVMPDEADDFPGARAVRPATPPPRPVI